MKKLTFLTATILALAPLSRADVTNTPAFDIKPYLLTPKTTYDGQPTLCQDNSIHTRSVGNSLWAGWVAYANPGGDAVMAAHLENGAWSAPEQINATRAQIFRPTLCSVGDSVWAFWTETGNNLARVMYSTRAAGKWSEPVALTSPKNAAQNQEVAVDAKGTIFVTWQEFHEGQYDIQLRSFAQGKWSEPVAVTNDKYDDWDPAIACDAKGKVWVAWSSYRDGDYDLYLKRVDQTDAKEMRISARGEYDLHPALTTDKDGRLWVAWDAITIPRHGASGNMTITGANLKKYADEKMNDPENPDQKALVAQIRLACLDGDKLMTIPKSSKSLQPPEGYKLAHTALPKISVDDSGTLWVAYRALIRLTLPGQTDDAPAPKAGKRKRQQNKANAQAANAKPAPGKKKGGKHPPYCWDVFVQSFSGGTWTPAKMLPTSDGTLEEVALVTHGNNVQIAYEMEHRRHLSAKFAAVAAPAPEPEPAAEDESDHHGDYGKVYGFNGDVYFAQLTSPGGDAAAQALMPRKPVLDKTTHPRVSRDEAHYKIEMHGTNYTLLWGDLHKHSNISRCSTGNEPSPDDHYKYAHDICQYDFLAMSDHAEHTSDFNWWRIQKLADLYNIPGSFSVLYGYEWSASWPIGHHNVIWPERPAALLRSSVEGTRTTTELWAALDKYGKPALTIPHTMADPGMGTRWDHHDEKYERIAEIFQACRGSYEYDGCPRQHVNATATNCFYQDGLAKGYHLGTICSSDHGWGTAYAVVYATENSRKAAWQGLYDRRCYGSTTYGLVVDFRVGDHMMGEEFSLAKPAEISIYARGTAPIRQIDIFSERKLVHSVGSVKEPIGQKDVHLTWTPDALTPGTSYYYARIIQDDDEMAWTSPVWITSAEKLVEKADAK